MADVLHKDLAGADLHAPGAHASSHSSGQPDALAFVNSGIFVSAATAPGLGNPTLSRDVSTQNNILNSNFEVWTDGASVAPDGWVLGAGTIARDSGTKLTGNYAAKVTRAGVDAYIRQDIQTRKGIAYYQGKKVSAGAWVWCNTPSIAKVSISDGVDSSDSSFHTGGGTWEYLTCTRQIDGGASVVRLSLQVVNGNGDGYFDSCAIYEGPAVFGGASHPGDALVDALTPMYIGKLGIGLKAITPLERLDLVDSNGDGAIHIGNSMGANPGTVRYTVASGFQGYHSGSWAPFGAVAAGTNKQIQFNNNGMFAGSSLLTWDSATGRLGFNVLSPLVPFQMDVAGSDSILVRAAMGVKIGADAFSTTPANSATLALRKSSNDTIGTISATGDGDYLGVVSFAGVNSNNLFATGGRIYARQVGAAGADYVSTDIVISGGNTSGLIANQLVVSANGNVGVGVASPAESLDLAGGLRLGNSVSTNDGAVRWSGTAFEGYQSGSWKVLVPDALRTSVSNQVGTLTEKTALSNNDVLLIEDSADSYSKKFVKVSNLSGSAVLRSDVLNQFAGITEDTALLANDLFLMEDSSAAGLKKSVKYSTLYPTDTMRTTASNQVGALTEKTVPTAADVVLIEDSAATYSKKKIQWQNLVPQDSLRTGVSAQISALTEKTTPVSADVLVLEDSAASFAKKKVLVSNLAPQDAVRTGVANQFTSLTEKVTPASADLVIIEDSAASGAKKKIQVQNLAPQDALRTGTSAQISGLTEKTTPASTDVLVLEDSAASFAKKKVLVSNLAPSDSLRTGVAAQISALTEKVTPVSADVIVIEDSASAYGKKKVQIGSLGGASLPAAVVRTDTAAQFTTVTEKAVPGLLDYLIIEDGDAAGAKKKIKPSSISGGYTVPFTFASLSNGILTVTHGLGYKYPIVQIANNSDQMIIPDAITYVSTTQFTVDLTSFGLISGTWNVTASTGGGVSGSTSNVGIFYRNTFTNADLVSGVFTVTHNKALVAPYSVLAQVYDNTGNLVLPDAIVAGSNSFQADMSSQGTIPGTWVIIWFA